MATPEMTVDELDRIAKQDQLIAAAVERDESRLRSFIRSRVLDTGDAEDILQDVFYELIQAYRMMKPAEQVTAWLFRVARNRITDLFRRKKSSSLSEPASVDEGAPTIEDLLPSPDAGPDALYARNLLLEALDDALDELRLAVASKNCRRNPAQVSTPCCRASATPCCICGSGCRSLVAVWMGNEERNENESTVENVENPGDRHPCHLHRRIRNDEPLELADARDLRTEADHLLAGAWPVDSGQDSVRRHPPPWRRSPWLEAPHAGTLRKYDSRRARTISGRHA